VISIIVWAKPNATATFCIQFTIVEACTICVDCDRSVLSEHDAIGVISLCWEVREVVGISEDAEALS